MSRTPTVFIIDDDSAVRTSLARFVRSNGKRAVLLPSTDEFLRRPIYNGPHCLLLELCVSGVNGLVFQQTLQASGRNPPIIFLAGYSDVTTSVQAIKAGAIGFLSKPCLGQELIQLIDQALTIAGQIFGSQQDNIALARLVDTLTPRERRVLELVVAGYAIKDIAMKLGLSVQTIKIHRMHMMSKLQISSSSDLARQVYKLAELFNKK